MKSFREYLENKDSEFKLSNEQLVLDTSINEAKLTKSEYKDKKQELIDLLWNYDKGEGFNKKEDIYIVCIFNNLSYQLYLLYYQSHL